MGSSLRWYRPEFDSPSVFCRLLDKNRGGHFFVGPQKGGWLTTKQQYLPSSNILQTRYLGEEGVLNLIDFFPRPLKTASNTRFTAAINSKRPISLHDAEQYELKKWLVRRVECIRGEVDVELELLPVSGTPSDIKLLIGELGIQLRSGRTCYRHHLDFA